MGNVIDFEEERARRRPQKPMLRGLPSGADLVLSPDARAQYRLAHGHGDAELDLTPIRQNLATLPFQRLLYRLVGKMNGWLASRND